jgi:RNA polymerase sigma-70 factor (ECF subfamily)
MAAAAFFNDGPAMSDATSDPVNSRDRLQENPEQVLADEFSRCRERLWRMVRFRMDPRLASRVDPDDVLQEAWLAATQRLKHFLAAESMSPFVWLRLIVGQTLVDVHRRHLGAQMRDAYKEVSLNVAALSQSTSVSIAGQLLGSMTSPSQALIRDETARQLESAIENMDPLDREVLALRHFEELTNSEVAEVLGIQQKAASIRYVRALRRLKELLAELPGFAEHSA